MKWKNSLTVLLIIISGLHLSAQESLDSLLRRMEAGNPALTSAQHLMEARKLEASAGLTPSNPEVEFAYLWGNPEALGNRTDFSVTQSFDFPTLYVARNRLSDINKGQAGLEYQATRQEIMLEGRQAWIIRVCLNKIMALYLSRLDYAHTVREGYERKLENGEGNQLQLNQARMKVISLHNEISLLKQKISKNDATLRSLTGNNPYPITDTVLPGSAALVFDSLVTKYQEGYINQVYQFEIDKKSKEVDVIFSRKLPKLKAGYYSEHIMDTKLQGIQAGITIPLWENARAVKSARARLLYVQSGAEQYWQEKQNDIRQLFEQWIYMKERVSSLEETLGISNDEALLRQAMEAGEISLTDYYYESDFYFQNTLNLLEFKKEMLLLEAELQMVNY